MTLLRLSLRLQLVGLAATAVIAAVNGFGQALAFAQLAGDDPAQRALFASQMEVLGRQLSYLLPIPAQLDTLAGYLHWRQFGSLPLVYAAWALVASSGAGRGDEERGLVEEWLAAGVGRFRYVAVRSVGFALAASVSIAVLVLSTAVAAQIAREPIAIERLAAQGLALLLFSLGVYAIGLLIAQQTITRRGALGVGAIAVLALHLINATGRMGTELGTLAWLSPYWHYDQERPLLAGGGLDTRSTLALAAEAVVLTGLAMVAFARRDLGGALVRARARRGGTATAPSRDPALRLPVVAPVWQQRTWILSWAAGLALVAVFFVSLTRTLVDSMALSGIPTLQAYFQRAGIAAYASFIGIMWFSTLLLLISIYAIAQVAFWSADDAEGRLATILSAPVSRTRVVVERLAAALLAVALITSLSSIAAYVAARSSDIALDAPRFALASALVLVVAYAFVAIGHAAASWRPRLAVVALSTVAVWSYFVQQFGQLFDWPETVRNLSLYALYGSPLSSDIQWSGIAALLAIGIIGTLLGVRAMRVRDVGA
jgi:ABC-2 type transport system permease protein